MSNVISCRAHPFTITISILPIEKRPAPTSKPIPFSRFLATSRNTTKRNPTFGRTHHYEHWQGQKEDAETVGG
jgi:hypothetical protein